MIDFFSPIKINHSSFHPESLYNYVDLYTESQIPDWETAEIILFDISSFSSNKIIPEELTINRIRDSFYNLFPGDWKIQIADLGSLILGDDSIENQKILYEIISFFIYNKKKLIILGENQSYTYAIIKALSKTDNIVNCSIIDNKIDLDLKKEFSTDFPDNHNYISNILWDKNIHLNNLHIIGCQTYLQSQKTFTFLKKMYIDCFRLGEIKGNINHVEPELRISHFVSIDIQAVKNPIMPLQLEASPNGLNGLEICKLSRFSGLSQKNKILGIFGFKTENTENYLGENLIAEMLWYFIEGKNESLILENISKKKEMITFHVPNNLIKMKFYKQPEGELWWVEINELNKKKQIFPCSYNDYEMAVKNKISTRILNIIEKNNI